jgi:2-iminoacetate synthase ThiH
VTRGGHIEKPPLPVIESEGEHATVQFEIADSRTPAAVAARLQTIGYEAVWKDWESALNEA